MIAARDLLYNFIFSGKWKKLEAHDLDTDELIRYSLFNIALAAGSLTLTGFGISVMIQGNLVRGASDCLVALFCVITILILRTKLPFAAGGSLMLAAFGVLNGVFIFSGDVRGFAALWVFSYPILTIFVLGLQWGMILATLLFCAMLMATLIPGLAMMNYSPAIAARFLGVYGLITLLSVVYEQNRIIKDRHLSRLARELQAERDEITAMKDNLKTGVFLLDHDFTIQPAYSKALETVLEMEQLQGVQFTDLLASSLKAQERETLRDYFTMVINRSFDNKMLEEINPIAEFVFFNDNFETEKNVRTSFAPVDRGHNEYFILGTVTDITAEVELQRQLAAEADKRDEEMRALFQVVNVEPRVFSDFIEDMEYEFDLINRILKDRSLSVHQAMIRIYQAVHAVKSNALILGLENFSGKLHQLESKIKKLQDQEDIGFEEVLHITVELENIMREKDKFRETLAKIQSFKAGDSRRQDRYVLIETLTKACAKAAAALEKKARFEVEALDGIILEYGPRRVIKEVLTQLVRNAVFHGIEHPKEREALGKDPEGLVKLSMKYQENRMIHLKLIDDGKGLNFDKIREKAGRLNLLPNGNAADRNQLLQVIFSAGFSTAETANEHAGRGVGLNLVKERIRDLRGSIKLQTEPGKGTAFNIYIPLELSMAETQAS
ncbi:MAG: hypothetical protein LBD37_08110 [Treponema sp.]|jgi:two-component system chemotaxis sensor kinase CheA|nr:hypothetical protein [Treponema sp.]